MTTHPHLPPPLWDRYSWQMDGACRYQDPEMFFVESERGKTRDDCIAAAKTMCATCPVLQACREYGLNAQEPYGIWGGLTAQERKTHLQHSTPTALPVSAHRYSTQP